METKTKKLYEAPAIDVMVMRTEGVICGIESGGGEQNQANRMMYGDANEI